MTREGESFNEIDLRLMHRLMFVLPDHTWGQMLLIEYPWQKCGILMRQKLNLCIMPQWLSTLLLAFSCLVEIFSKILTGDYATNFF
jgi:hypothetical protein